MIKMPSVTVEYVKLAGAIDQANPVFSIKPGYLLDGLNYEPGIFGGYKRIDGFERFDGHAQPSAGSYWVMPCTITGTIAVGNTVTGVTSAATGKVLQVNGTTELVLGRVTGTFNSSETINVGGVGVATTTGATVADSASTNVLSATYRGIAADDLRVDILAVPGSGSILGAVMYGDVVYAFRNNAGGTACDVYKSTASGWSLVNLGAELSFTNGKTIEPAAGLTVTGGTSGATGVVVALTGVTGTWASGSNWAATTAYALDAVAFPTTPNGYYFTCTTAGTSGGAEPSWPTTVGATVTDGTVVWTCGVLAAGRLHLKTLTGTFQAESVTFTGGSVMATGAQVVNTLLPSGRFETIEHNFYGSGSTKLYGCDGVNRAWQWDGSGFVSIRTGMTTDTPSHIAAHKKHLFFSFGPSVQHSSIGDPITVSAVTGASEIAVGENVSGFSQLPGQVLGIFTRNQTYQLQGSSAADWVLDTLSPETGALPYTIQNIGYAYALDDRGIVRIAQTLSYGNFEHATMSRIVQTAINTIRSKAVASTVYRSRNQYRIYGNDGTGIVMGTEGDKITGFIKFEYPVNVTCAWSGESSTGAERVLFGSDNGYVYEANVGSSFDGDNIDSFLILPHNTSKTPRYRKQYKKIVLELVASEYSAISFFPEFSYGDTDVASHEVLSGTAEGGVGGYWDISTWDTFFYDGKSTAVPEFSIAGTGNALSILFYSRSAIDLGHTLNGVMVHYIVRRISR